MSNKDRVLAIVAPGILLTSAISVIAQDWTLTSAPNKNWLSVASSADGSKLVAVVGPGRIYTSTNSGATWISNNVPNTFWRSVASSADGGKLIAAVDGGLIYTSTNAGATWVTNGAPSKDWFSVASSAD